MKNTQTLLKAVQDATDELYTSGTPAIYQAIGKVMRLGMLEVALPDYYRIPNKLSY
jgi:hypothetical protein